MKMNGLMLQVELFVEKNSYHIYITNLQKCIIFVWFLFVWVFRSTLTFFTRLEMPVNGWKFRTLMGTRCH